MINIFFSGDYDAVIVCLGSGAAFLPELSGRLPLRTCRGVIAHLQIPDHIRYMFRGVIAHCISPFSRYVLILRKMTTLIYFCSLPTYHEYISLAM